MSFELAQPPVQGTLDSDLLATLSENYMGAIEGSFVHHLTPELLPLYEKLATIGGVALTHKHELIGRSSVVKPHRAQDKRGWHFDAVEGSLVSSAIPTEFLLGDDDVIRNFWEKEAGAGIVPRMESYNDWEIARKFTRAAGYISDSRLEKDFGFTIWSAEPYEVVPLTPVAIHRSQINRSSSDLLREYAMFYTAADY